MSLALCDFREAIFFSLADDLPTPPYPLILLRIAQVVANFGFLFLAEKDLGSSKEVGTLNTGWLCRFKEVLHPGANFSHFFTHRKKNKHVVKTGAWAYATENNAILQNIIIQQQIRKKKLLNYLTY